MPLALAAVVVCSLIAPMVGQPTPSASAPAPQPASQEINNLVHAAGVATAPLGTLGKVEKMGTGPVTLILLPGAGFEWDSWKPFMDRHLADYTMYAITPAGYGSTKPYPMPENPEDFTQTPWTDGLIQGVADLIKEEKLTKPIIVGHHLLGGYYAVKMATTHPELIGGAVVAAGELMRPAKSGPAASLQVTPDDQLKAVHERWVEFFRTVTLDKFKANQYSAAVLANDPARGAALHAQETSQPLPVQVRYFLEFNRTNIIPDLAKLTVPVMAIQPKKDFNATLDRLAQRMGGGEAAREQVLNSLIASAGSEEAARRSIELDGMWESAAKLSRKIHVQYVENAKIFVMDDQPARFDALLAEFVASIPR